MIALLVKLFPAYTFREITGVKKSLDPVKLCFAIGELFFPAETISYKSKDLIVGF